MTKKEIMQAMGYSIKFTNSCVCENYYYERLRKEVFIKALQLYNTVSHTKGRKYLEEAYKYRANVVKARQHKYMQEADA